MTEAQAEAEVVSLTRRPVRDWSGRLLALTSLAVALGGLAYNTWRNETTEAHRNVRHAAFVLLEQSAALQERADVRYYGGDRAEASRIAAWGKAGLIRDLGPLVSPRTGAEADRLFATWSSQSKALDARDAKAEAAISAAIARVRRSALDDLRALD